MESAEPVRNYKTRTAALIQPAMNAQEREWREALKIHWLHQIECNHYEQNDSAICACGWKSERGFNVGKAVEFWVDHVFAEAERLLAERGEGR